MLFRGFVLGTRPVLVARPGWRIVSLGQVLNDWVRAGRCAVGVFLLLTWGGLTARAAEAEGSSTQPLILGADLHGEDAVRLHVQNLPVGAVPILEYSTELPWTGVGETFQGVMGQTDFYWPTTNAMSGFFRGRYEKAVGNGTGLALLPKATVRFVPRVPVPVEPAFSLPAAMTSGRIQVRLVGEGLVGALLWEDLKQGGERTLSWSSREGAGLVERAVRTLRYRGLDASLFAMLEWELETGGRIYRSLQVLQPQMGCSLDLVLVLDRSGSVDAEALKRLAETAAGFGAGLMEKEVRVGAVAFCQSAMILSGLGADRAELRAALTSWNDPSVLSYTDCEGTWIRDGLKLAAEMLKGSVNPVLLLLSDGVEHPRDRGLTADEAEKATEEAARRIQEEGVQIWSVAVGAGHDAVHLQRISNRYFGHVTPELLGSRLRMVADQLCPGRAPHPDAGADFSVRVGESRQLLGRCDDCEHTQWVVEKPVNGAVKISGDQVQFENVGRYVLRLEGSRGAVMASDTVSVDVTPADVPLRVSARAKLPERQSRGLLEGSLDSGERASVPHWEFLKGPGKPHLTTPEQWVTEVELPVPGHYQFRLMASDERGQVSEALVELDRTSPMDWEWLPNCGYVVAGLGGLRGWDDGFLRLEGVRGPVRKAWLVWNGPSDSQEARGWIRVQGRWIEGVPVGDSNDNAWRTRLSDPFGYGRTYRADVTGLVRGDGEYALDRLSSNDELQLINGVSLMVFYEEADPLLRRDYAVWVGNDSNGDFERAVEGEVDAIQVLKDGRVLIGGSFTKVAGVDQPYLACLLSHGELDRTFRPRLDGAVRAMAMAADGRLAVGGDFAHWNGQPSGSLMLCDSMGHPVAQDSVRGLKVTGAVRSLAWIHDQLHVGLEKGMLLGDGREVSTDGPVLAMVGGMEPGDPVCMGGEFRHAGGQTRNGLAWVDSHGEVTDRAWAYSGTVYSLLRDDRSLELYVAGDLHELDGTATVPVMRFDRNGYRDERWMGVAPQSTWNGTGRSLAFLDPDDGENTLVMGGHFRVDDLPVSVMRPYGAPFVPVWLGVGSEVTSVGVASGTREFWVGGHWKDSDRLPGSRVKLRTDGAAAFQSRSDGGWWRELPATGTIRPDWVELHVSDGQYCGRCVNEELSWDYEDPPVLLNGREWLSPKTMMFCDVEHEHQVFGGITVPWAHGECGQNQGLWDVVREHVPEWAESPMILRHSMAGPLDDLVSLVGAVVSYPSGASEVQDRAQDFSSEPGFWRSEVEVRREHGVSMLGLTPGSPWKIMAAESAGGGVVSWDGTRLDYEPPAGGGGADQIRVVAQDAAGVPQERAVQVKLAGHAPQRFEVLPESIVGRLEPATGEDYSVARGPGTSSRVYRMTVPRVTRLRATLWSDSPDTRLLMWTRDSAVVKPRDTRRWEDQCTYSFDELQEGDLFVEVYERAGSGPAEFRLSLNWDTGISPWVEVTVKGMTVSDGDSLRVSRRHPFLDVVIRNLGSASIEGVRVRNGMEEAGILEGGGLLVDRWVVPRPAPDEQMLYVDAAGSVLHRVLIQWRDENLDLEIREQSGDLRFQVSRQGKAVESGQIWTLRGGVAVKVGELEQGILITNLNEVREGRFWAEDELGISPDQTWRRGRRLCVPRSDEYTVMMNSGKVWLDVLKNDTAVDGFVVETSPQWGVLEKAGEKLWYTPAAGVTGHDMFRYRAWNEDGSMASAEVSLEVKAPVLALVQPLPREQVERGSAVTLEAELMGVDPGIVQVRFEWNGRSLGVSDHPPFRQQIRMNEEGEGEWMAVGTDAMGREHRSQAVTMRVGSRQARAEILSPLGRVEEGLWEVTGSVSDHAYTLRLVQNEVVMHEVRGHGPVSNGVLGTMDASLTRNGPCVLVLELQGGWARHEVDLVLDTGFKLGQFTFTEVDIELATPGLPLVLARTYDSLHTGGGDFGPGWSLSFYDLDIVLNESRIPVRDDESGQTFSMRDGGDRSVTMTLPDGRRVTFEEKLEPGAEEGGAPCFCFHPRYRPAGGAHYALGVVGNPELRYVPFQSVLPPFWLDAGPGLSWESYDYQGWVLTNAQGTEFRIERPALGEFVLSPEGSSQVRYARPYGSPRLREIQSKQGDWIRIGSDGVEHRDALGRLTSALRWERDERGRMKAVYLQGVSEALVRYEYEGERLSRVVRQVEPGVRRVVRYLYERPDRPWYLTRMVDGNGVTISMQDFDARGRLLKVKNGGDGQTVFQHDVTSGSVVSVDALGQRTLWKANGHGDVTHVQSPDGSWTCRSYDDQHRLVAQTNAWGSGVDEWTVYQYDSSGKVKSMTTAGGTIGWDYDAWGNILEQRLASGTVQRQKFDEKNRLLERSERRADGTWRVDVAHTYDPLGRWRSTVQDSGIITTNFLNPFGQEYRVETWREGSWMEVVESRFDALGRKESAVTMRPRGDGGVVVVTNQWRYSYTGELLAMTDAMGGTRQMHHGSVGQLSEEVDESGRRMRHYYDRVGRRVETLSLGTNGVALRTERKVHDALGRIQFVQDACSPAEVTEAGGIYMEYDASGRVVASGRCEPFQIQAVRESEDVWRMDVVGEVRRLPGNRKNYDVLGRVLWSEDADGVRQALGYDAAGRVVAITNAWGTPLEMVSLRQYSPEGRLLVERAAGGASTLHEYDEEGRLVRTWHPEVDGVRDSISWGYAEDGRFLLTTNEMGVVTRRAYDAVGNLDEVREAWGSPEEAVTQFVRHTDGRTETRQDALRRVTISRRDALLRRTERELPLGGVEKTEYDAVGRVLRARGFDGRTTDFHYDEEGRMNVQAIDGLSPQFTTFNDSGLVETVQDSEGFVVLGYNDQQQLERMERPGWGTLMVDYTPAGRLKQLQVRGTTSWALEYTYDQAGRLKEVTVQDYGFKVAYDYDAAGYVSRMTYGNGMVAILEHNARGLIRSIRYEASRPAVGSLAQFEYEFNPVGQRVRLAEWFGGASPRVYDWQYDLRGRLTRESISDTGVTGYEYDLVGNLLRRSSSMKGVSSFRRSYDWNDQVDTDGNPANVNSDYDAAGNRVVERPEAGGDDPPVSRRFDAAGRLVQQRGYGKDVLLGYDYLGQCIRETVRDLGNDEVSVLKYWVTDINPTGYSQVLSVERDDVVTTLYVPGLSMVGEIDVQAGRVKYYVLDGHGSVRGIVGERADEVQQVRVYEAYGSQVDPEDVYK